MKETRKFLVILIALFLPFSVQAEKININTATAQQLARGLTGVGKKKARAIVSYRQKKGPFKSPQDLVRVRGIGKKTLAKNLDRITVAESPEQGAPVAASKTSKKRHKSPISLIKGRQSR